MNTETITVYHPVQQPICKEQVENYLLLNGWKHELGDFENLWRHESGKAEIVNLTSGHFEHALEHIANFEKRQAWAVYLDIMND
jgi:hypothetical protein